MIFNELNSEIQQLPLKVILNDYNDFNLIDGQRWKIRGNKKVTMKIIIFTVECYLLTIWFTFTVESIKFGSSVDWLLLLINSIWTNEKLGFSGFNLIQDLKVNSSIKSYKSSW